MNTDTRGQVEQFVDAIFEPTDIVETRAINKCGRGRLERSWMTPTLVLGETDELQQKNVAGSDIYIGINPRIVFGKGKADDVKLMRCLAADIENVDASEAVARIEAGGMPEPTVMLNSGHGVHCYWRLTEPITDPDVWRIAQRKLAAALDGDSKICDPPRVMRLPGFMNWKEPAAKAELLHADRSKRYPLDKLTQHLPELPQKPQKKTNGRQRPAGAQPHANQGMGTTAYGNKALAGILGELAQTREGERNDELNKAAFRAGQLVAGGEIDELEAVEGLKVVATRIGLDDGEIGPTIDSGMKKGKTEPRLPAPRKTPPGEGPKPSSSSEAVITPYSKIERRQVEWLWQGRIPLGRISLVVGKPGAAKSFLTCDLAARLSKGEKFPDGATCTQGDAIIISAEDSPNDTIGPRLDAHEADDARIYAMSSVRRHEAGKTTEAAFTLADLDALEDALQRLPDLRLVVVDPIGSFLGGKVDAHRDNETRSVLSPLAALAEKYAVAMLLVVHTRKGVVSDADESALGSRAFVGIARTVWHLSLDKDDPERRLFLAGKNNLAKSPDGLAFRIENGRVEWEQDPVRMSANEALAAANYHGDEDRSAREGAADWLADLLAGGPMPSADIKTEAQAAGFSWATVRRAKDALKIKPHRDGFGGSGAWHWQLPASIGAQLVKGAQDMGHVSTFEDPFV